MVCVKRWDDNDDDGEVGEEVGGVKVEVERR